MCLLEREQGHRKDEEEGGEAGHRSGLKFGVVEVALRIPRGFLFNVAGQCVGQVYACLIGQRHQNPKHIGHLITEVCATIGGFFALVAKASGHDASQFADLFSEDGQVGQFTEIANSDGLNPFVNLTLRFA